MKKTLLLFVSLTVMIILLSSCGQKEIAPTNYKEFNKTMENYFLAVVEEDLYTMKQYLPNKIIEQNPSIKNATKNDKPSEPDMKENMGDKYSIKGFDYFYEDYQEIYYLIEFYNYQRNDKESLVFGVRKENDDYMVFSAFGHGGIGGSHVKEFNDGDYFTISSIKKAMREYPEHTFVVKEYPEA